MTALIALLNLAINLETVFMTLLNALAAPLMLIALLGLLPKISTIANKQNVSMDKRFVSFNLLQMLLVFLNFSVI
jgi:hypothetical protein